ncbi:MAG TPA: SDR family oxidoreductase [Methylomirabilota bacterium]|jgi:dTDP-4-dehydrorhamnose reductase
MKILVTGAAGMLGSALVPALAAAGHDVYPTDIRTPPVGDGGTPGPRFGHLDVRSRTEITEWFDRVQPDFVMHLAAETDVDLCQAQPDHAYATNAIGTKHVALACQAAGLPLTYVSTAGVFDGEKDEPYVEFDAARPIAVYGASKLAGEQYVQTFLSRFYVVRAGWMIGGGEIDHKFVGKILHQLDEGATTLYAVTDKLGTPTYAPDFAACLVRLMETGSYGLYHMACRGYGTRYDVAKKILEILGRTDHVELVPVGSEHFREQYPAPRPRSEMMRNLMLDLQGLNTMRPWQDALDDYLARLLPKRADAAQPSGDLNLARRA